MWREERMYVCVYVYISRFRRVPETGRWRSGRWPTRRNERSSRRRKAAVRYAEAGTKEF